MEVKAKLSRYRQSPRKVRLVADSIRGLDTTIALNNLKFSIQRAARPIYKLIESAVANAEHNNSLDKDNLFVKIITVDEGPTLKRWRARAFGRSATIRKRTSHITIILDEKIPSEQKTSKTDSAKKEPDNKKDVKAVKNVEEARNQMKTQEDKNDDKDEKTTTKTSDTDQKIAEKGVTKGRGFVPKVFQRKSG